MRLTFGEFLPDQPGVTGALTEANNVIPQAVGYGPFPSPVDYSGSATETLNNLFAAKGDQSVIYVFAGGADDLFLLGPTLGLDNVSRPAGYVGNPEYRWNFVQFGSNIIAANGANPLQSYITGTSTTFADVTGSPEARYITVVRDFVVTGSQDTNPFRVQWSGQNDATTWTFSQVTQSDFQDIPDSGVIQGVTGGEYGLVFLERSIYRMSYVGTPLIFQFDEIAKGIGCFEPTSIVQYRNMVFFLSDDGFYMCDGQTVRPIGAEKIDRFFLANFNSSYGYKMSATVDPLRSIVIWAYPSAERPGDVDSLLIYNFDTGKWSTGTTDVNFVGISQTPGLTLEALDEISTSIDALGSSLDSRLFVGGKLELAGGRGDKIITFTGSPSTATVSTGDIETENRFSMLKMVRPIIDNGTSNVALASRARLGDAVTYGAYQTPSSEDRISVRGVGRYHRLSFRVSNIVTTIVNYSLIPTALLSAATGTDPAKTLFRDTLISGRPLGDITNNGLVNSADSLEYLKWVNGTQTNPTYTAYIENVFNPYLLANPVAYQAYLTESEASQWKTAIGADVELEPQGSR